MSSPRAPSPSTSSKRGTCFIDAIELSEFNKVSTHARTHTRTRSSARLCSAAAVVEKEEEEIVQEVKSSLRSQTNGEKILDRWNVAQQPTLCCGVGRIGRFTASPLFAPPVFNLECPARLCQESLSRTSRCLQVGITVLIKRNLDFFPPWKMRNLLLVQHFVSCTSEVMLCSFCACSISTFFSYARSKSFTQR